jgi:D-3-phosphoglycerate dehydrogenase
MGAYPQWDLDDLEARYNVHKVYEAEDRETFLKERAASIRAIATRGELGASAELMNSLPKLEVVSVYGVGTDAVNLAHARDNGIRVTNTPDVLSDDVADMAIGLLLSAARLIPRGDAIVRSGQWGKAAMPLVTRVTGKRVGVVGMGRIGQAIARRAVGFDCDIRYFSRNAQPQLAYKHEADLVALADWAEFLIVIVPGGDATKNIINAEVLKALFRRAPSRPPVLTYSTMSQTSMSGSSRSTMPSCSRITAPARSRPARRWDSLCATISRRILPVSRCRRLLCEEKP